VEPPPPPLLKTGKYNTPNKNTEMKKPGAQNAPVLTQSAAEKEKPRNY